MIIINKKNSIYSICRLEVASRKKHKKYLKKRKHKDIERSSGDSDGQMMNDDDDVHIPNRLPIITSKSDQMSGMEADSESQGSGSKGSCEGCKDDVNKNASVENSEASGPVSENAPDVSLIVNLFIILCNLIVWIAKVVFVTKKKKD